MEGDDPPTLAGAGVIKNERLFSLQSLLKASTFHLLTAWGGVVMVVAECVLKSACPAANNSTKTLPIAAIFAMSGPREQNIRSAIDASKFVRSLAQTCHDNKVPCDTTWGRLHNYYR